MLPLDDRPFAGRSRTSDSAVVVLPQPDSPAMPSASPSSSVKLTPSTALTGPDSSVKWVFRSSTTSSGASGSACFGSGHWRRPRIGRLGVERPMLGGAVARPQARRRLGDRASAVIGSAAVGLIAAGPGVGSPGSVIGGPAGVG